jgi:hypothetical protein
MTDVSLTVEAIMRHGTTVYGDRGVLTCTDDGTRSRTDADMGRRRCPARCRPSLPASPTTPPIMW